MDILILSYRAYGRDFEAFLLLKHHLEHRFDLRVRIEAIRDLFWIDRLQPALLVVTDTKNPANIRAAKYARARGVLVVTIEGEGIFNPVLGEEMIWGWNEQKELIEHLRLQWSERNRRHLVHLQPQLASSIVVTGCGRMDRYRVYAFEPRESLLARHDKGGFEHVVGYAGWGFSKFADPSQRSYQVFAGHFSAEQLGRIVRDRSVVNAWINRMIEAFPEVLFILKQHPGDDGTFSELDLHRDYDNVLRLRNEESLEDILNACDLWMDYSSTTSMEAWLMDKPTLSFVPSDTSFFRMGYEQGSVQIRQESDWREGIRAFLETGTLAGFADHEQQRRQIIHAFIGWADGLNSLRAACAIGQLLRDEGTGRFLTAPAKTRLTNRLRHVARLLLTFNGLRQFRDDGFTRTRVQEAEQRYDPQIAAFLAQNKAVAAQVLAADWRPEPRRAG